MKIKQAVAAIKLAGMGDHRQQSEVSEVWLPSLARQRLHRFHQLDARDRDVDIRHEAVGVGIEPVVREHL